MVHRKLCSKGMENPGSHKAITGTLQLESVIVRWGREAEPVGQFGAREPRSLRIHKTRGRARALGRPEACRVPWEPVGVPGSHGSGKPVEGPGHQGGRKPTGYQGSPWMPGSQKVSKGPGSWEASRGPGSQEGQGTMEPGSMRGARGASRGTRSQESEVPGSQEACRVQGSQWVPGSQKATRGQGARRQRVQGS